MITSGSETVERYARTRLGRAEVWLFVALTVVLTIGTALLLPGLTGPLIVVFIPTLVAAALVRTVAGRGQVRSLLFSSLAWRVTLNWIGVALGLALAVRVGVGLLGESLLSGYEWRVGEFTPLLMGVFLFAAAEEIGWRGFALPVLLARGYRPLGATLLLAVPWAVLHLPLLLPGSLNEGSSPWAMLLLMIAIAVIVSWAYLASGMSVMAAVLFHGGQNALSFLNADIDPRGGSWVMALVFGVVALAIVVLTRGRLGFPGGPSSGLGADAPASRQVQY